jgi:hypothetical protein
MPAALTSQGLAQGLGQLLNIAFVALVPSPVAFFLGFDQAGFLQNSHVVRNGGLGKVNAFFDITGAETNLSSDGASAPDFQHLQDAAAGRVSDGVKRAGERLVWAGHAVGIDRKLMRVNVLKILDSRFKISDCRFPIAGVKGIPSLMQI